jgi:mannonate dehydratase
MKGNAVMSVQLEPGIKLSIHIPAEPTDEELTFIQQLGVDHVYAWVSEEQSTVAALTALRERVSSFGLTLFNVGCFELGKSPNIHLATPQRDQDIERFKRFIRNLGAAGIHTTTFTWEPDQVWSTEPGTVRGGAVARAVDMDVLSKQGLTHGRVYTHEEIWENYTYFIKEIIPVAEEVGVRLALHPNDPPVGSIAGIPCLINSFESYKRAFEIGDSDNLGMEFCTGCWLEGGDGFGDMLEAIRTFGEQGKIFIVHFRNVTAPLPHFVETFLDEGYFDMYRAMRALQEVSYDGTLILDHSPKFTPDAGKGASTAYAIGYMRALLERAREEIGN